MDIIEKTVCHKHFGKGVAASQDGRYLSIRFHDAEKKFLYPDAFKEFLTAEDEIIQKEILREISQTEAEERQRAAEQALPEVKKPEIRIPKVITVNKRTTEYPETNVAFKCNYCDGGASGRSTGYNGVCSDKIISYNIETAHRTWCSAEDCSCRQYLYGEISRSELDGYMTEGDNSGYVCYESAMLRDWRAAAGVVQTGEKKGIPIKLYGVKFNSLCVLTTRLPNDRGEKYRQIFAAFLVDENYEGDSREEGYVTAASEYRIKLSPAESAKMYFWKYHSNRNKPESALWGSGLYRYFDHIEAVQILRDIAEIKKNTEDGKLAADFLYHFCRIHHINLYDVPEPQDFIKKA